MWMSDGGFFSMQSLCKTRISHDVREASQSDVSDKTFNAQLTFSAHIMERCFLLSAQEALLFIALPEL